MLEPETEEAVEIVNVLAVDDVPENLVALATLLKRPGIRLLEARSGNEALEALLENDIALALVDVNMPGMDGFELVELMRGSQRTRDVPVIFLTAAVPDAGRVFQGYEAGAVDFLFKPIHPHLLVSKVEVFTELHRQKRKLARQVEQIRQAQAMSDIFVGVLGHDLRNPLSSIVSSATLLELKPAADVEATRRRARAILRASWRMERLIAQVLAFAVARVKGSIPVSFADADLSNITRHFVGDLEPQSGERVQVEIVGSPKGRWDPDRMAQVVSNLVGNAIQHGDREGRITIRIDGGDADRVVFSVHNGGAIPGEARADLFAPFKTHSGTRRSTGLGLYIVSLIVEAHRGTIDVASTVAEGTTFAVTLPRRPDEPSG
ncbi:MAG TPA: hybrid sensor histidine kinase/response regulator [Polyangiaceae bacterium]